MTQRKKNTPDPDAQLNPLDSFLLGRKRQCTAMSKRAGERCKNFALLGSKTCRMHGSATRKSRASAARIIADASGWSAEFLVEQVADPTVDLKDRIKIAQSFLDRAGVIEKNELFLSVEVQPWEKNLESTIVDVDWSEVGEDVVDAEIVETTPTKAIAARLPYKPDPMVRSEDVVDEEAVSRARAEHDFEAMSKTERIDRRARFLLNRMNNEPKRGGPR